MVFPEDNTYQGLAAHKRQPDYTPLSNQIHPSHNGATLIKISS